MKHGLLAMLAKAVWSVMAVTLTFCALEGCANSDSFFRFRVSTSHSRPTTRAPARTARAAPAYRGQNRAQRIRAQRDFGHERQLEAQRQRQRQVELDRQRAYQVPQGGTAAAPTAPASKPTSTWEDELPTLDRIRAVNNGSASDSNARQVAAMRALLGYIDDQTKIHGGASESGKARRADYSRAIAEAPEKTGDFYYLQADWFRGVMHEFLPAARIQEYTGNSLFDQRLDRDLRDRINARTQASTAFQREVEKNVEQAKQAKTDMSVFGIALGAPLNLPGCGSLTSAPSQNCVEAPARVDPSPFGGFADAFVNAMTELASTSKLGAPAGMTNVRVQLAADRCPSWASCWVVITTKSGYALAATFQTTALRGDAKLRQNVVKQLNDKYGRQSGTHGSSQCAVSYNNVELGTSGTAENPWWSPPGLNITYVPYGNPTNCTQGRVEVQTSFFTALERDNEASEEAAQPKL